MGFGEALGSAMYEWDRKEEARLKKQAKTVTTGMYEGNPVEMPTNPNPVYGGESMNREGVSDKMLLDSISKNEGTYDTGYDTEYGYGEFGEPRKKFNEMTINEVMDYQDNMRGNSTAVGRYQTLRQTLDDAVNKYGFGGDQLFDEATQDKLMINRLKKMRGYNDWRGGTLGDKDFKKNLSREFASVQDPYTGKGYYKGQNAKPLQWD